ncbi:glutaminyl-peptide cyclotransferase [Lentzea terrae]|uniref:glutaminyl-peptide cyclotransferase n=1 Tax=Lentzea terrae TaxID=2200761 RepID=UPI0013005CFE|nr:glutaminyl-peptide cyclotransferase [Lentzea terrae]
MNSLRINGFPLRGLAFAALLACAPACAPAASTPPPAASTPPPAGSAPVTTTSSPPASRRYHVRVIDRVRTDRADARGLELVGEVLVENTGRTVRAVAPSTGEVRAQQSVPADGGIALTPAGLWHVSSSATILRDPVTLVERRRAPASHETWGLCHDGIRLVQSDGTTQLLLRDRDTAGLVGEVRVATREWGTARLGELHCVTVNGYPQVWAVVTGTDWMIRVDLSTGLVTAVADLTAVTVAERPTGADEVIGGVAAVAGGGDELWLTGRHFDHRYRIRLQPGP